MLAGVSVLAYTLLFVDPTSSALSSTLYAFIGLGLMMIGLLLVFATPEIYVSATLLGEAVSPPIADLALAVESLKPGGRVLHVPSSTLGSSLQVVLLIGSTRGLERYLSSGLVNQAEPSWGKNFGILRPTGLGLLEAFERAVHRDFFGLEFEQLSRILARALIIELQLASDFSLSSSGDGHAEALWRKASIPHQCIAPESKRIPELCPLCSAVACALAKATTRPVELDQCTTQDAGVTVTSSYRIIGAAD